MRSILAFCLLLSTCATAPVYAKVYSSTWDGTCIPLPPVNENNKHNPEAWKGRPYIPSDKMPDDSDIATCLPPPANGMGAK